jgi:hypothetical protein
VQIRVIVLVVLLVAGGAVALWRAHSSPAAAGSVEAALSCLQGNQGYQATESKEAEGARQLMVTTPSGRVTRDGDITVTHQSSATVIFFQTAEDAQRWSDALSDISSSQPGGAAANETIGNVIIGWSVPATHAEIATVRGCVSG